MVIRSRFYLPATRIQPRVNSIDPVQDMREQEIAVTPAEIGNDGVGTGRVVGELLVELKRLVEAGGIVQPLDGGGQVSGHGW